MPSASVEFFLCSYINFWNFQYDFPTILYDSK